MSSVATSFDNENNVREEVKRVLTLQKPQLLTEWKKTDCSGFEPTAKLDLQVAVIHHLYACTGTTGTSDDDLFQRHKTVTPPEGRQHSTPDHPPKEAFTSSKLRSPKSFKQAVAGTSPTSEPSHNFQYEKRLAAAELTFKQHKHRLNILDHRAKALEREFSQLHLVLYGVSEEPEDDTEEFVNSENAIAYGHLKNIAPEAMTSNITLYDRLGKWSASSLSKPRPLRISFASVAIKHDFLKHAKTFRQAGVRCDDYLTRSQQQDRQALSGDFDALKAKGHAPFFRGAELKYRHADKMYTCKQSQAQKAPTIKS